jgi:hypothetical protein
MNKKIAQKVRDYLDMLNKYYIKLYNKANQKKDNIISSFHEKENGREEFLTLKRKHHNQKLADFVTNANEMQRIIEYNYHLHQKIDPIFLDPDHPFIKAHFYAPRKQVFGNYIDTFWLNVIVIWVISIILFIMLYFRVLRRSSDLTEYISNMIKRYF